METKFTKGEWKSSIMLNNNEISNIFIYSELKYGNKRIGSLLIPSTYLGEMNKLTTEEAKANAKLIAVAPKLLHLLNEVVTNTRLSSSIEDSEIVGHCKDLIKKATE